MNRKRNRELIDIFSNREWSGEVNSYDIYNLIRLFNVDSDNSEECGISFYENYENINIIDFNVEESNGDYYFNEGNNEDIIDCNVEDEIINGNEINVNYVEENWDEFIYNINFNIEIGFYQRYEDQDEDEADSGFESSNSDSEIIY